MKTKIAVLLALNLTFALFATSQSVGIGTSTPNSKAILDIKATDNGILFPRLISAQRDAISNPPNGDARTFISIHSPLNCSLIIIKKFLIT